MKKSIIKTVVKTLEAWGFTYCCEDKGQAQVFNVITNGTGGEQPIVVTVMECGRIQFAAECPLSLKEQISPSALCWLVNRLNEACGAGTYILRADDKEGLALFFRIEYNADGGSIKKKTVLTGLKTVIFRLKDGCSQLRLNVINPTERPIYYYY